MKPSYKPNNAKYCKTYRNKNIDTIKRRDKDRKEFTGEYFKYCDTKKYEEQKRKDWERKKLAKEMRKETVAVASTGQNQESTSTLSSAFKQKQSFVL